MIYTVKKYTNIRSAVIVCVIFIIYFALLYKNTRVDSHLFHRYSDLVTNVSSSLDIDDSNVLPELGGEYKPQAQSIFFHETSFGKSLNSRQACAVESAARAHPDWDIHVVFSARISEQALEQGSLRELRAIENVKLMTINITDYAIETPLEDLIVGGALSKSQWVVEHTSDVLRFLTLYKWGGVYMDLDVVVVKSLNSLARNWAARESDLWIGSATLAMSTDALGRNVSDRAIRDIKANFRGDIWGNNGPGVITRVLESICSTNKLPEMSSATCNGFEVYGPPLFFPVHFDYGRKYFMPGSIDIQNVYVHHIWNHLTRKYSVHKDSPYAKLAKTYCPTIFKLYADNFGN